MEIKDKSLKELETLSQDIRDRIIDVVSRKGGHFSSTLGAVELTIGMHYVLTPLVTLLFLMYHINVILINFLQIVGKSLKQSDNLVDLVVLQNQMNQKQIIL